MDPSFYEPGVYNGNQRKSKKMKMTMSKLIEGRRREKAGIRETRQKGKGLFPAQLGIIF